LNLTVSANKVNGVAAANTIAVSARKIKSEKKRKKTTKGKKR
jgi:hypothetical protein